MPRERKPDPIATTGEQLHALLSRGFDLAREQADSAAEPAPDPWQRLAQETYTLRSALPADDTMEGALHAFALELEHTFLARSRLESNPPTRVMFVGQTLEQARREFDAGMIERLMPLAATMAGSPPTEGDTSPSPARSVDPDASRADAAQSD